MTRCRHRTDSSQPSLTRLRHSDLDLKSGHVKTIVWATGFRPDYSWLDVPVLDEKGMIRHDGGVAESPGMYLIGTPFLRRRKSSFIDGGRVDAEDLTGNCSHISRVGCQERRRDQQPISSVASCIEAVSDTDPRGAVREVVTRFVTGQDAAEPPVRWASSVGLHVLYRSPDLTVLDVIWPPLMTLYPHDHRMWAAIGIYSGREDNAFYRRDDDSLSALRGAKPRGRRCAAPRCRRHPQRSQPSTIFVHGSHSRLRRRLRRDSSKSVGFGHADRAALRSRGGATGISNVLTRGFAPPDRCRESDRCLGTNRNPPADGCQRDAS